MRFDRIALSNFKCYASADVTLDPGVTVIHGPNGSGKSSLLEACFFALYGTSAFDRTLDEIVTIGAEAAEIDLEFTHQAERYHLRRRIRAGADRAATAECTLEGPMGTVEGVREVERAVADLLRMDGEAFVNCAYVRQGEINKLIDATPGERQDMIDDLLQLGTLEVYRERAGEARRGVAQLHRRWTDRLEDRADRIEELEAEEPHQRLNALRTELAEVDEEVERLESNREDAREARSAAAAVLEEFEENREALAALDERITTLRDQITETEADREELAAERRSIRESIEALDSEIETLVAETDLEAPDLGAVTDRRTALSERLDTLRESIQSATLEIRDHQNEADRHDERAADLETRAEEARERAADLEADVAADVTAVEEDRAELDSLEAAIEETRAAFEADPVDPGEAEAHHADLVDELEAVRERETEVREAVATARSRLEEAEALIEEGKCPACGQPVDESPHVENVDGYRERVRTLADDLDEVEAERADLTASVDRADDLREAEADLDRLRSERAGLERLIEEREAAIEKRRAAIEDHRESADDLEAAAEEARAAATDAESTAADARSTLGDLNARKDELDRRRDRLDRLESTLQTRDDQRAELERLAERRAELADRNDERREHLAEARDRREQLDAAVDEDRIEQARTARAEAEDYLEQAEAALDDLDDRRSDLRGRIGAIENRIENLEALREERDQLAERVAMLDTLHDEVDTLESTYGELRAELRRRNVDRLEALLNDTFDLVYQNDAYTRLELSAAYELTVRQKDGEALDPEQLSGGERALFNLSLRAAIYRLLAEGIDGAAPMPPLILDEPTVFLDSIHVTRLVELVETMRDLGVEQIVVVSHDEGLVAGADALLTVEKDPTTNRSTVGRPAQSLPAD